MAEHRSGRASSRALIGAILAGLVVAIGLGGWVWLVSDRCSMPARAEITSIRVTRKFWAFAGDRTIPAFQIPEQHWDAILAALAPCRRDPDPVKWECLCNLEIGTRANRNYSVMVFWLPEDDDPGVSGAFRIDVGGRHAYFRGGNSVQVRDAIIAAYDQSQSHAPSEQAVTR